MLDRDGRDVDSDLLEKLARDDDAAAEYRRAAEVTRNERERALLRSRAVRLLDGRRA